MEETSNVPKLRFIKGCNFDAKYVSDYLKESKIKSNIDNVDKHLTVKLNLKGVIPRKSKTIEKEGATTQYIRKSGQFIYGKQNLYKGALGLIPKELDNYLSSSDIPSFDFINNINHLWFYYYFSRKSFYESLEKYSTGTGSKRISPTDFLKIKLFVPPLKIQEKIANFLSIIDKKIDLNKNQMKEMESFKKGLLQKMFAEDDDKLRFNYLNSGGFKNKNDFKSVKLESLIKKGKAGGTPKSSIGRYYKGNIPFLSISDMTMQGKYITFTSKKITKEAINDSSAWIIPKNSLLYSIYASIGFVSINKIDLSTSQAIFGIILKDNVNIDYIYYYLTYFKRFVHKFIETGTQGNLNKNILYNFIIKIPNSIEEQEKIASFLSLIDKKIDLTQNQITEMEKFKKGLLQQMFV